ncbi:MAG TPA: hypothetical protein DCZ94_06885 [Lentisphaeria bacterium]|nr:MAG: hypothetical protein A2X48_10500 [Lentisphaerae bacterium GWF2_49_21]HBC86659.1 hypothetical protein [Lentisphaeria bacterium]
MTNRISIDDIAKIAGVSRGTVSRAFNERSDISKKTRAKILEISRKHNYFPNNSARGLAKGKTECIGIVVPDLRNPFMPEMITAIEKAAKKHGFSALLSISDGNDETQSKILTRMAFGQVDGIITTPCETAESIRMLNSVNTKIPVVCLKNFDGLRCSSVSYNDRIGVQQLLEHLVGLGHMRIAFVSPPESQWTVSARYAAYDEILDSLKIKYRKNYELPPDSNPTDIWKNVGKLIFDSSNRNIPTAILAFDDIIAVHVMKAAEAYGKKVPHDVSVAGFDNISFSAISSVPLTTVCVNRERLGETAMELLLRRLKDEIKSEELHHIVLIPELVVRSSTAAPHVLRK